MSFQLALTLAIDTLRNENNLTWIMHNISSKQLFFYNIQRIDKPFKAPLNPLLYFQHDESHDTTLKKLCNVFDQLGLFKLTYSVYSDIGGFGTLL